MGRPWFEGLPRPKTRSRCAASRRSRPVARPTLGRGQARLAPATCLPCRALARARDSTALGRLQPMKNQKTYSVERMSSREVLTVTYQKRARRPLEASQSPTMRNAGNKTRT